MPDQDQLGTLPPYEQIAPRLQSAFPDLHPDAIRQTYEQALQLAAHRQRADQAPSVANNPFVVGMTSSVPFVSPLIQSDLQQRYDSARSRLESGNPQPDDYAAIAVHERMQQDIAQRGVGGRIGAGLAAVPAIAGEVALGGAVGRAAGLGARAAGWLGAAAPNIIRTPEAARQVAEARGAQSPELRDWAAASGYAGLQTLVYGTAPRLAQAFGIGGGSIATRAAITLGGGLAEQQVADAVGGLMGVPTGYGVIGHMIAGRHGEAWQDAAVQLATLSALFGMHEATRARPPIQQPAPGQGPGIGPATPQGPVPGSQPPGGMPGQPGPSPMPGPAPGGAPGAPPGQAPPSGPQQRLAAAWTEALRRYAATGISSRRAAERITQQINDLLGGRASGAGTRFEGLIELWNANPHWGRDEAAQQLGLGPQMARSMRDNPARPFFEALLRELPTAAERAGGDEGPLGGQQAQPNVRQTSTPQYPFEPPTVRPNAQQEGITRLHTVADIVHQPPQGGEPGVERPVNAPGSLVAAPEPPTGVTPPPTGQNAPAVTPTPLERIAAMRRRQGMVRTPEQPTQAPKPARGPEVGPTDVYDRLPEYGLNAQEQHVLREMGLQDRRRSLRDVASDPIMQGLSHQTIANRRDRALEKIRQTDPVRADWIEADIGTHEAGTLQQRIENGKRVTASEFHNMTQFGQESLRGLYEKQQTHERELTKLEDQMVRELEANNGKMTPEREAEYAKLHTELNQKYSGQTPLEKPAARRVPQEPQRPNAGEPMAGPAEAAPVAETGVANRPGGGGEREGEPPRPTAITPEEATHVHAQAKLAGIPPKTVQADLARIEAEAREEAQRASDAERAAGIAQPAKPGSVAAAAGIPARGEQLADELASELNIFDAPPRGGRPGVIKIPVDPQEVIARLHRFWTDLSDMWDKWGGATSPAIERLSPATNAALARFAAAKKGIFSERATPYYTELVLGKGATEIQDRLHGDTFLEERYRYAKDAWHKLALLKFHEMNAANAAGNIKAEDQARNEMNLAHKIGGEITTRIGKPESSLPDEATYQHNLASPEYQQTMARWKQHIVPEMEANYKAAMGLDPGDSINSFTQIPDRPMNIKHSDDAGKGFGGDVLRAPRHRKFMPAEMAFLASDNVDPHLSGMIENSLGRWATVAAQANLYRMAEAEGVGQWVQSTAPIEGYRILQDVNPPRKSQAEAEGRRHFALKEEAFNDFKQALGANEPYKIPYVSAFNHGLTGIALGTTAEMFSHGINLSTLALIPGVAKNVPKNLVARFQNDTEIKRRIMELARMGAMKGLGLESTSPVNPLQYTRHILDFASDVMRLAAEDAFNAHAAAGNVKATEGNKRDFINQAGNYNQLTQSKIVAALRDSGFGPFSTAVFNFHVQAFRRMLLRTGMKVTSREAAVRLGARMLTGMLLAHAIAPLMNLLSWGNPWGDENTPIGGIKVGQANGKTQYIDLWRILGPRRAADAMGLTSLLESARVGAQTAPAVDRSVEHLVNTLTVPEQGPVLRDLRLAFTGRDVYGRDVAGRVRRDESQTTQNLLTFARSMNPVVFQATGGGHREDRPWWQRLSEVGGPLGIRESAHPPGQVRRR